MTMVGPLDLDPVFARVRAEVPPLRAVEGAAEAEAAIAAGRVAPPVTYVLLASESAQRNRTATRTFVQQAEAVFGLLTVVRNYRRADLGDSGREDLQAILQAQRAALVGWTLPGQDHPIEFHSGRLFRLIGGAIWWQDVFRTPYRIEVRR